MHNFTVIYGYIGYTNEKGLWKPLRHSYVELISHTEPAYYFDTWTYTDITGKFELITEKNYLQYVTIYFYIKNEYFKVCSARDDFAYYGAITLQDISIDRYYVGAFEFPEFPGKEAAHIFDTLEMGRRFFSEKTSLWSRDTIKIKYPMPHLSQWIKDWKGERIEICTDHGYDKFVILHEYGHAIMYYLYGYLPAATDMQPHDDTKETNPEFAFKEAWPNFYALLDN